MFSIIISEKGGGERRETFEKAEINVGRVQNGNDLVLPKGNVSKQHARLIFRDGRFIVTDLRSTNGTYVNGRKIAQATIVREGDKVYIGDFVLRLDGGAAGEEPIPSEEPAPPPPAPAPMPPPLAGPPPLAAPPAPAPMPPPLAAPVPLPPRASAFPAPQKPSTQPPPAAMVAPPPIPAPLPLPLPVAPPAAIAIEEAKQPSLRAQTLPLQQRSPLADGASPAALRATNPPIPVAARPALAPSPSPIAPLAPTAAPAPPVAAPVPPAAASSAPIVAAAPSLANSSSPAPARDSGPRPAAIALGVARDLAPRDRPRMPAGAGYRLALLSLVERIQSAADTTPFDAGTFDVTLVKALEQVAREQAAAMKQSGDLPDGIDAGQLAQDALAEFASTGPLGPLLEDPDLSEIHVISHDRVLVHQGGKLVPSTVSFTSDRAVARALSRLAALAGSPIGDDEFVVERRLPRGAVLVAARPPVAPGFVLTVKKAVRRDGTLEDAVGAQALSRPMASFLEHCIAARANVLVVGPSEATAHFLAALASQVPEKERIVVVGDAEELAASQAHVSSLAASAEAVVAATRMVHHRVFCTQLAVGAGAALVEAAVCGADGVVAAVGASTLRQGLARFAAQVALARPGVATDAARESVVEAFDVVVEVALAESTRYRVSRIAELTGIDAKGIGAKDLFAYTGDAADPFVATGVLPRAIADFAGRGVKVDPSLFKRAK
jgi:pilus assembly protein CpaF